METCRIGEVDLRYVAHGTGTPVIVLHGAGVDHREPEACFDPILGQHAGLRRIYPDLPGMGRTQAPESVRSADDVLAVLLGLVDEVVGDGPALVVGHSAGAYYARGIAAQRTAVVGIALVCPLLPETRDVPAHRPIVASPDLGDDDFRSYFVMQTPEMLERYEQYVVPGAALADHAALERIGERWELTGPTPDGPDERPTLLVAGRRDSTVGYAATISLLHDYPNATLALVDGAGHALPHERPALLGALVAEWLDQCGARGRSVGG
jgi:pimeloyl-ACP methyl ester carboxylesterase